MPTLTPAPACRHATIRVATRRPTEFIDITADVEALVAEAGLHAGLVNVQTLHTTTAVIVNEHEPLLLGDFEAMLEALAPASRSYRHDDLAARGPSARSAEPENGHAHCRALLLPSSACLNVEAGRVRLGRWQRVFLVELDGPRDRQVSVLAFGTGR